MKLWKLALFILISGGILDGICIGLANAGAISIYEMGIRHDLFQRWGKDADTGQRLHPLIRVAA